LLKPTSANDYNAANTRHKAAGRDISRNIAPVSYSRRAGCPIGSGTEIANHVNTLSALFLSPRRQHIVTTMCRNDECNIGRGGTLFT
jgi:hypothetical protein